MKTTVTEIAGKFINKTVELMTNTVESFAALEKIAFAEARNRAAELIGVQAETVDAAIVADAPHSFP